MLAVPPQGVASAPPKSIHVEAALQTLHICNSNPHIHMYHYNAQQSRQSKGRQSRLSDYVDELGSRGCKRYQRVLVLVDALVKAEEHVRHPAEHKAFAEIRGGSSRLRQWRTGRL